MATTFDLDDYEATHGRRPRGYGSWAFRAKYYDPETWTRLHTSQIYWVHGAFFGDAKYFVRAWAELCPVPPGTQIWIEVLP